MAYFSEEDILHLTISDEAEAGSVEVSPNITAELGADGAVIGLEIVGASSFIRDSILDTVQGRLLEAARTRPAS